MSYIRMESILRKILKFSSIYIIPFLISMIYFYINVISNNAADPNEYLLGDSSVWCKESGNNSKLCKFKNICYNPDLMSFLFFLGNLSVIKGLYHYKELQTIQLSSVNLHNKFEANISVVDTSHKISSFKYIKRALLFSRFKPDNIMHIIHDDLIPLFLTLEDICLGNFTLCEQNYRLILHDSYPNSLFYNLYVIFSSFEPVLLHNVSEILCFQELHMGLLKDSVFYEYGYDKPQGPVKDIKLYPSDLIRFASYIRNKLHIKIEYSKNAVVLVSRKNTRRILNENNVIHMLENAFKTYSSEKIEVICLDLYQNDTFTFIKELSRASAFVGMHGAEMILSIFLRSNAIIVELFPYAIKQHVSFIKPIANIKGIYFNYISWENVNRNNSVFHPHADPMHGGISHLPTHVQKHIKNAKEIPPVYCCDNPIYLYYMYQDTWIDFKFENYLIEKLHETGKKDLIIENDWLYPSTLSHFKCSYNMTHNFINISWSSPFNIGKYQVFYDVFLVSKNIRKNIITEDTSLVVDIQNEYDLKIQIWITSVSKTSKTRSKDVLIECIP